MEVIPLELIEKVTAAAQPEDVIQKIGYRTDTVQKIGNTLKCFCPIHHEPNFRTLIVELGSRSYRCSNTTCPGHAGGDMIDLYARSRDINYSAALAELANLAQIEVDLGPLGSYLERALAMAKLSCESGTHEKARAELEEILRYYPDCEKALRELLELYKKMESADLAAETTLRLASALAASERHGEAAPLLREYLSAHPKASEVRLRLIHSLEKVGDRDALVSEYANMADEFTAKGDIDQAIEIFGRIEKMAVPGLDVGLHVFQLLVSAGKTEEAVEIQLDRAQERTGKGDPGEALEELRRALEIDPTNERALISAIDLATGHALGGDALEFAALCTTALINAGILAPALVAVAKLKASSADPNHLREIEADLLEAQGELEAALDLWLESLDVYEEEDQVDHALKVVARILRHRSGDVALLAREAGLLRRAGKTESARERYTEITDLFEKAGQMEAAAGMLENLIALDPQNAEHRARQLGLYIRLGVEPLIADKASDLASFFCERGEGESAIEPLRRALAAAPENAGLHQVLAEVLLEGGRKSEAVDQFCEAARASVALGEIEAAATAVEKGLTGDPTHFGLRESRAEIKASQGQTLQAMGEYRTLADDLLAVNEPARAAELGRKLIEIEPDHLPSLELLAKAYRAAGEATDLREIELRRIEIYLAAQSPTKALEISRALLATSPGEAELLGKFLTVAEAAHQLDMAFEFIAQLAVQAHEKGGEEEESALLGKLIEHDPVHRAASRRLIERASASSDAGVLTSELDRARSAFASRSQGPELIVILEELCEAQHCPVTLLSELAEHYRKSDNPQSADALDRRRLDRLTEEGRTKEAIEVTRTILDADTPNLELHERLIDLLLQDGADSAALAEIGTLSGKFEAKGDYAEAVRWLDRAIALSAGGAQGNWVLEEKRLDLLIGAGSHAEAERAVEQLANAKLNLHDYDGAVTTYERALEFTEDEAQTFRLVIDAKKQGRDFAGALTYYRRLLGLIDHQKDGDVYRATLDEALELEPSDIELRRLLAEDFLRAGQPERAESTLLELIGHQFESGDLEAAGSTIQQVLDINKASPMGRVYHGELLARRGDSERALAAFRALAMELAAPGGESSSPGSPYAEARYYGSANLKPYTFSEMVEGPGNTLAHSAAFELSQSPETSHSPLYIYGASGLGKTHLLRAVANEVLGRHPEMNVLLLRGPDLEVRNGDTGIPGAAFLQANLILIDDIDEAMDRPEATRALERRIAEALDRGKQLVLTARRSPRTLDRLSSRSRSLLASGLVVQLDPITRATKLEILRRELAQKGRDAEIPEEVLAALAESAPDDARSLKAALGQVMAMHKAGGGADGSAIDEGLVRKAIEQIRTEP